ncbi:uncharacterized protein ARMOST_15820 [Armillaria ostoyae]|uniref:Uncharacterized protein n=1 Tax=Armillaria ostoyae TaxID=47428 RepID=A0A284RUH1_ARMOS|nr:uncharacterized protein ARMOST_15820 [Armillaria ostoyae]
MGPSGHETSIFRAGHRAPEDFLGISSFSSLYLSETKSKPLLSSVTAPSGSVKRFGQMPLYFATYLDAIVGRIEDVFLCVI